jgi:Ca2+-binding RTX toxin-like protein
VIAGGPADDTIVAGLGNNQTLTGGGGGDVFVLSATGVHDKITDFSPADDTLKFAMSAADFKITAARDGHAVVHYGNDVVDLLGVTPRELSQANFVLPAGTDTGGHTRGANIGGDSAHHHFFDHRS